MKCNILSNGTLQIIPENDLEHFALMHWFDDYTAEPSRAVLQCVTSSIESKIKDNCFEELGCGEWRKVPSEAELSREQPDK